MPSNNLSSKRKFWGQENWNNTLYVEADLENMVGIFMTLLVVQVISVHAC